MPLNILRLNHQPSSHPNDRIAFIKPLPGRPDSDVADTFLRAIAAQCLPVMKQHHLSITTLEEHEPNNEFIGRNFNNGEIVQLVLRSRSGGWVSFNMVQMVMMHELAHNLHMNHGKGFWQQRNIFAGQMKDLWQKKYTGEGLWGNGRTMGSLAMFQGLNVVPSQELADLQVCGGTFRSRRGRKRKRGTAGGSGSDGKEMTWREKEDRRIERKFGNNGQSLGGDEDARLMLEIGRKGPVGGKPRVAGSKRGRELRAAAALARFDVHKAKKEEEDVESDSGEEYEDDLKDEEDARDAKGQILLDSMGFGMVRVCGDGEKYDVEAKREMQELEMLESSPHPRNVKSERLKAGHMSPNLDQDVKSVSTARDDNHLHEKPPQAPQPPPQRPATPLISSGNTRVKRERNPIYDIPEYRGSPTPPPSPLSTNPAIRTNPNSEILGRTSKCHITTTSKPKMRSASPTAAITIHNPPSESKEQKLRQASPVRAEKRPDSADDQKPTLQTKNTSTTPKPTHVTCPICSLSNPALNPTCTACTHVLDVRKDPHHWRCSSDVCKGSQFINAGDCGVCGICGARRKR